MRGKAKAAIGTVLIGLVVAGGAWWGYLALTWRITAGPMVQQVGTTGFVVVWRTNRSGQGWLEVLDGERIVLRVSAAFEDGQHVARANGLTPGHAYVYRLSIEQDGEQRTLGGPWTCRTDAGPTSKFHLLAFGDSGTGERAQYALAKRMAEHRVDLIIHTGDVVYKRGEASDYPEKFYTPYAAMIASVAFMPCIGNHDYDTDRAGPLLEAFVLPRNGPKGTDPERHYWFDYGCARFAAIDSDVEAEELRDRVAPWLTKVFASAERRWRFVYLHYPPYTGSTARGPVEHVQQILVPVFERVGVDMVFSGHNHLYERSKPILGGKIVGEATGIIYVVTGAGGADLRETRSREEWPETVQTAYDGDYSFSLIDVSPDGLGFQQINRVGEVIDRWGLSRGPRASGATASVPSHAR